MFGSKKYTKWSKSSSGFRGIFKDLVKGLAVVASIGLAGLIYEEKVGEENATRTNFTWVSRKKLYLF